jgi:hypothetical protein
MTEKPPESDAQNSAAVLAEKGRPRGKPFTGRDDPRRNNGGVPREARELRELLKGEAEEIHEQLAALRKAGNVAAILYSHRQLVGDVPQAVDLTLKPSPDRPPVETKPLDPAGALRVLRILAQAGCLPAGMAPPDDEDLEATVTPALHS